MKKISFNDYIPEELADNESCRLITTEQYQEYLKIKEEDNHWHKEAERISHEAIGARLEAITLKKKLDIALETLGQISLHSDDKLDAIQCAKTICEIEESK